MKAARIAKWVSLTALPFLLSAPVRAETLEEAVAQALATSPDVLIDVSRRLSVEQALNQAEGAYLPRADVIFGRGRQRLQNLTTEQTYGGSIGQIKYDRSLTLSQMLFDGFATSSEIDRNRARVSSAAHRVGATSEQVALRVVEAYLEVLRNQEIIALTRDNLTVHERTYDQIKLRAASGVGRKADQDQIEARLALARSNLTAAEANLRVAEINYRLVVGTRPGALNHPKPLQSSLFPPTAEAALPTAFDNSRILKSANADIESAMAQHRAAHAPMYPRVDLEFSASQNSLVSPIDIQPDSNRSAMLRLRYNLFRGHSDSARVAETKFLIQEAEEIARRTERQIEQSLRLSWNAYASAHERLPFLTKHAESSQLTRDAYAKQFSLGQRTLLDLLDAENEAFTASSNLLNGRYVELFSRYRVLADMSMLLQTLGVPHLETSIDPTGESQTRTPRRAETLPKASADTFAVSASDYGKVIAMELPPPEAVNPKLLADARIDPAALPAFAQRPPSGATILAVGRSGMPAASAARLRHRLSQLGFPVLMGAADGATLAIGPYADDRAAAADAERLAELGLAARAEKAP